MQNKTIFRVLPGMDPYTHLAAEESAFFTRRESFIFLWRNTPCVILGKNQDIEAETTPLCRKQVPVLRRITGGGAVYHDPDNINFSFIQNGETPLRTAVQPVIRFLTQLGLPVTFSGRNDILLDGKKISGCARRIAAGRTLTHGTLLFRRDAQAMDAYLSPPADKLARHGVASVHARTGELAPYLPQFSTADEFMRALAQFLQDTADPVFVVQKD